MKKYDNYKDSGVEWIANIPEHWYISKAKFVSNFRMGQTILKEDLIDNGKYPVYSATEGDHFFGYIDNPNFILEKGDIVIPARGNSIGYVVLVNEQCVSTQTTIASKVNMKIIYPSFLFYYYKGFKSILFHFDQTAIPQITVNQVENNIILLPSIQEQTTIASFLDYKTSLIDATIEKKKRLMELLKEKRQAVINEAVTKGLNATAPMKDSGVEWLGEIPEHWSIVKLKHITNTITDGAHISPDLSALDYPFISTVDLQKGEIIWEKCLMTSESNYFYLKNNGCKPEIGDVLYSKDGTIGKTTVINEDKEFVVASSLIITKPNISKIVPEYLEFLLRSNILTLQIDAILSGVALRRISLVKFSNLTIPLPSLEDQKKFLDDNIELNKNYIISLTKLKNSILLLQTYRQSLISEAVTGKIDVRDWEKAKKLK